MHVWIAYLLNYKKKKSTYGIPVDLVMCQYRANSGISYYLIICIVKQIIRILLSYHGIIDIARISLTEVVKILPTSSAITLKNDAILHNLPRKRSVSTCMLDNIWCYYMNGVLQMLKCPFNIIPRCAMTVKSATLVLS